ncbi:hypothetical protein DUNSADRAFT_292 [Dunaliella salina]|uniref:Uncharacterized protein n=1 Tax=Dunaliella salina TaxID=3046 RepID=A0ABQ7GYG0_DUNSA|nr:hypothetical protein DUNSADRAFT_292 [Dunaliella salina]|eukprot:KAF5839636.1 hypothetical protein DUNSADRAFT_292 [Dunaliella salina]
MNADSETLLGFLQASISQQDPVVGADPEVVALALHSKRDSLLHVLDYKRPSPESARQVESLSVTTPKYGEQRLDAEPDRRLALLLSRELQLDEVLCVEYLIAALEERGSFTADTAAGLYLEERQSTVKCLMLLLQDVLQQDLSPQDPPKPRTVAGLEMLQFVGRKGKGMDHSLEPNASSTIHQVLDEAGVPVSRAHLLQLEKRLLCKCLLYALLLQQHVAPQVVASMLELLGGANARLKAAGLAPPNAVVAPAVTTPPTEGLPAVLRLCWGTLLASANPAQHRQEASRVLVEAQAAGVFRTLRKVFDNPNLKIDDEAHQEAVATCVYRLLGQALVADRALRSAEQSRLDGPLSKAMAERCMKVVKRTGGGGVAFAPLAADDAAMNADHNGTVLGLLSAVFAAHPRLWLAADTHDMLRGPIENLIARTVTHDVMKVSPEVRVPFLEMMSSLAVGEYGTSLVLRQFAEMARSPSLEVLTWRKLFTAIVEYCVRYNTVLAEIARAGLSTGSLSVPVREERLMNTHEANILIAFLALFRQVIEQGTAAEVRAFLEGLERELSPVLSGFPLTEPMFQLMCHPVPNTVKASLDEVLSSMAHRFKDTSGVHLLERLVQCAAVTPGGPMLPGMPRLDLGWRHAGERQWASGWRLGAGPLHRLCGAARAGSPVDERVQGPLPEMGSCQCRLPALGADAGARGP